MMETEKKGVSLLLNLTDPLSLFHTPEGEGLGIVSTNNHRENWPLNSKGFQRWLAFQFFREYKRPPRVDELRQAIRTLEAKAQYDSPEESVFIRVAPYGEAIYIDLCNDAWEAIEIVPNSWQLVSDPPVRFRRAKGCRPCLIPLKGGR